MVLCEIRQGRASFRTAPLILVVTLVLAALPARGKDIYPIQRIVDDSVRYSCTKPCSLGTACPGETVTFRTSFGPENDPNACIVWHINPGGFSTSCVPVPLMSQTAEYSHTFQSPGTYEVSMSFGPSASPAGTLVVLGPPTLENVTARSVLPGSCWNSKVCLAGTVTNTNEVTVNFGDGETMSGSGLGAGSFCHQYQKPGHYKIEVATASCGHQLSKSVDVFLRPCSVSEQSCCGKSLVWTDKKNFYALNESGDLNRVFWADGRWNSENIEAWGPPVVRGSLVRRNSHHVAGVNEDGQIVITWNEQGPSIFAVVTESKGIVPCSLAATEKYDIFGVNYSGELVHTYWSTAKGGWESEVMPTYGGKILVGTIIEMEDGRIAGLNEHGQLWNIWWNDQKHALSFDIIDEGRNLVHY